MTQARGERRTRVDALLIAALSVVAALLGFSGIWDIFSLIPGEISPWWTLATALPASLLVLTKRRAPVLSLVGATVIFAIDLFTTGGLGPLVVLLDVLWTAAFLASAPTRRRILIAMVLSVVVLFVLALMRPGSSPPVALLVAVQFGAFVGTDYWWAVAVSQAHQLAELQRQRADDAAAAAARERAEAVQREREDMARELHDVVAGHVLAMAIRAEAALSSAPDESRDRDALQAVRDAGLDAHSALRTMISVLRRGEGELAPTPSLQDLDGVIDDARRGGLEVTVVANDPGEIAETTAQALVRIVREALANALRHAAGAEVDVAVARRGDDVMVRVDSRGGASAAGADGEGGWGLSMLEERVDALGGRFDAGPHGEGWRVQAMLPVRPT